MKTHSLYSNPIQSSFFRKTSAAALLALIGMVSAHAQAPAEAPVAAPAQGGGLTEKITLEARGHGPVEKTTVVNSVAGPNADSPAVQTTIPEGTEGKKYRVNAKGAVAGAIAADRPVTLTFMARSPTGNKALVVVHTAQNPDRVKLISDTQFTPEWKAYTIKGAKPEGFAAGEAFVEFQMGEKAGVIEISDVVLSQ